MLHVVVDKHYLSVSGPTFCTTIVPVRNLISTRLTFLTDFKEEQELSSS